MREGVIYRATAGFYSVYCPPAGGEEALDLECRGRGIFRKEGRKPLVGDRVRVQRNEDGAGTVDEIFPRKNELLRPPVANLDHMVLVLSVTDPAPNLAVVDKYLALLEHKEIEPLVAVTKSDIESPRELADIYRRAGFSVFVTDYAGGGGMEELARALRDKFSAVTGNTGVGKSTLLNALAPSLDLPTGGTSKKLGRGRNTTRHVETHRLPGGGFVADTPGFTSLELVEASDITKDDLAGCFREFGEYLGRCKFLDCSHTVERGCAVRRAVEQGEIGSTRHQSYRQIYDEIKDVREWERR